MTHQPDNHHRDRRTKLAAAGGILAPDVSTEAGRVHRTYGKLQHQHEQLQAAYGQVVAEREDLRVRLKRRTRALWTGFAALQVKASFGVATVEPGSSIWWACLLPGLTGLAIAVYVAWPNIHTLIRLSADSSSSPNTGT